MIHTLHSLFETNALDFTKTFAIHAFDAFIPNHVLRCITIINGCYQYSCKVNKKFCLSQRFYRILPLLRRENEQIRTDIRLPATGDQPEAIAQLTEGVREGLPAQTLLGVTGSGKTFTIANVIANINKPTLILSHNKTLAAQLYSEFKGFFPNNAVEYYVSYYDYYQPKPTCHHRTPI